MIYVVSTGLNAKTKQQCINSVQWQLGCKHEHIYVEAGEQDPPKTALENAHSVISKLPKDAIVALLDGDDTLAHSSALSKVQEIYDRQPTTWLTFGSFKFSDGRTGISAPYTSERYRTETWRASHLKTFRAGLFQKIKPEDLQIDGEWQKLAWDMAIMFPMLEMAGPARTVFNPEVLYIYNLATSFEFNTDQAGLLEEKRVERITRSRKPYGRVQGL